MNDTYSHYAPVPSQRCNQGTSMFGGTQSISTRSTEIINMLYY